MCVCVCVVVVVVFSKQSYLSVTCGNINISYMILFVKTSLGGGGGGGVKKTKRTLIGFLWKTSFMVCFVETKKRVAY